MAAAVVYAQAPCAKRPGGVPGLLLNMRSAEDHLPADFFVDLRADDFFAPALLEREALDFLALDFEALERDFDGDFFVAADLAIRWVL